MIYLVTEFCKYISRQQHASFVNILRIAGQKSRKVTGAEPGGT